MRGKAAACEKRAALAVTGGSAPFPRCFHRSFRCSTHPFHIFYLPFFCKDPVQRKGFYYGKSRPLVQTAVEKAAVVPVYQKACAPGVGRPGGCGIGLRRLALPAPCRRGAARNGRRGAHHPAGKNHAVREHHRHGHGGERKRGKRHHVALLSRQGDLCAGGRHGKRGRRHLHAGFLRPGGTACQMAGGAGRKQGNGAEKLR